MSYESMVDHLRSQLTDGASHRRRREQRTRRVALAALVVFAVATAGILMTLRSGDDDTRMRTTPGDARLEVCHAFLDYQSSGNTLDRAAIERTQDALRSAGAASGDDELEHLSTIVARVTLGPSDVPSAAPETEYFDALGTIHDRCKALGDPDFNPVIVPAPLPPKPNVDLSAYGRSRMFGPPVDVPVMVRNGRELSPVQVASTEDGVHIALWSTLESDGQRNYCISVRGGRQGSTTCGSDELPRVNQGDRPLAAKTGPGGTANPVIYGLESNTNVSFAVLEFEKASFYQQPVFGRLLFVWDEGPQSPRADFVVRAFDTNGVQLDCIALGTRTC